MTEEKGEGDIRDPGGVSLREIRSPARSLFITVLALFFGEIFIMGILESWFSSLSPMMRVIMDALLLSILVYPVLHLFIFRRLVEAAETQANLARELKAENEERRRVEYYLERLEDRFNQFDELARITEKVNAKLILDDVLDQIFDSFRTFLPYDRIGFALIERRDGEDIAVAQWARSEASEMKLAKGYSASLASSSLQRVLETRRPRIINDLERYLEEHPDSESTKTIVEEGVRSSLTCPLIAADKPVGFLFFSSLQPNTYRESHIKRFLRIAHQLSLILEKCRLYQELIRLNDLKNRFLGMAAHDLRNPIQIIRGYHELLLDGAFGELTDEQKELFQSLVTTCDDTLRMLNDLLDISAIESGQIILERHILDIGKYIEESLSSLELLAIHKGIRIAREIPANLPSVRVDPVRIHEVISNLVSNAVKYSYSDSEVAVRVRRQPEALVVSVTDRGQGIPDGDMTKLFKEFGKTSNRPTGGEKSHGLGLAICRKIVEAHGGKIWAENNPEGGCTFSFTLLTA